MIGFAAVMWVFVIALVALNWNSRLDEEDGE